MRISAKARYGLAAVISMAYKSLNVEHNGQNECITIISLSEKLGISKIYLEQVFSLLKRGGIVNSTKGSQGGYTLTRPAKEITVFDVLYSIETSLFEKTEDTVSKNNEGIERVMQEMVFDMLNVSIRDFLTKISLEDITSQIDKNKDDGNYMYYL